jgi:hypothetical protein
MTRRTQAATAARAAQLLRAQLQARAGWTGGGGGAPVMRHSAALAAGTQSPAA